MSFPRGTEMFQFPRFASATYGFSCRYPCGWVSPFGHLRIKECYRLPEAFRRLPRPSSPLVAKASSGMPLGHLIALISNAHLRKPVVARLAATLRCWARLLLLLGTVNTAYRKTSCIEINPNRWLAVSEPTIPACKTEPPQRQAPRSQSRCAGTNVELCRLSTSRAYPFFTMSR